MTTDRCQFLTVRRRGPCAALVELPETTARTVFLCEPTDRAVIVGSAQSVDAALAERCAAAGYALVRRRSGGGGVVIEPGGSAWVDFFLPSDDPLFRRDVREGSYWVGELWAEVVRGVLPGETVSVHCGGLLANEWSATTCFLGIGPGEVLVDDHKVVGLSQRRTRAGAWFFSLAYVALRPARDAALLVPPGDATVLAAALADGVRSLPVAPAELEREVERALATRSWG